jgi:DNA-binding FadR family transcriptional regulator
MKVAPRGARRRKLSDVIAEETKRWMVAEGMRPGDRLPNERQLIDHYGCSKGTVREALKALEVQGLIATRTGPNGGAYLRAVPFQTAAQALRNYLHFQDLTVAQVNQLRSQLEPQLVASLAGGVDGKLLARLEVCLVEGARRPASDDEALAKWQADLEFHNILAEACPDPLLAFICHFVNDLIYDLLCVNRALLLAQHECGARNVVFHRQILGALGQADAPQLRQLMADHMADTGHTFCALDSQMAHRFSLPVG